MSRFADFLKRKDIEISFKRYGIDAMSAMAICSALKVPAMVLFTLVPVATCLFHLEMNGAAVNSGMGTCGLCGPIGVWTGWSDPTAFDWLGLALVSIVLPAIICPLICQFFRRLGWIRPGDLKL